MNTQLSVILNNFKGNKTFTYTEIDRTKAILYVPLFKAFYVLCGFNSIVKNFIISGNLFNFFMNNEKKSL